MFNWLLNNIWVIFILVTVIEGISWRYRGNPYIEKNPELLVGYRRYSKRIVFWGCLPWVVMGICSQAVELTLFDYLYYKNLKSPTIIGFYVSFILVAIIGFWWIFFKGGAEILVRYPGLFRSNFSSPSTVKAAYVSIIVSWIVLYIVLNMFGIFPNIGELVQ